MAKKNADKRGDYTVGRGKPPRSTQFKPGQSGNPGGRRKGCRNLATILTRVLETEIDLSEGGRKRKVPLIEAIILRQAQEALKGQPRAIENLLDRFERHEGARQVDQVQELPEEDEALLDWVLQSLRRRTQDDPAAEHPSDAGNEEEASDD